jgi:hypothetical protein
MELTNELRRSRDEAFEPALDDDAMTRDITMSAPRVIDASYTYTRIADLRCDRSCGGCVLHRLVPIEWTRGNTSCIVCLMPEFPAHICTAIVRCVGGDDPPMDRVPEFFARCMGRLCHTLLTVELRTTMLPSLYQKLAAILPYDGKLDDAETSVTQLEGRIDAFFAAAFTPQFACHPVKMMRLLSGLVHAMCTHAVFRDLLLLNIHRFHATVVVPVIGILSTTASPTVDVSIVQVLTGTNYDCALGTSIASDIVWEFARHELHITTGVDSMHCACGAALVSSGGIMHMCPAMLQSVQEPAAQQMSAIRAISLSVELVLTTFLAHFRRKYIAPTVLNLHMAYQAGEAPAVLDVRRNELFTRVDMFTQFFIGVYGREPRDLEASLSLFASVVCACLHREADVSDDIKCVLETLQNTVCATVTAQLSPATA